MPRLASAGPGRGPMGFGFLPDLARIQRGYCRLVLSTSFTSVNGSTAQIFWGTRQSSVRPTTTIFYHTAENWDEVRALENATGVLLDTAARVVAILAKDRL